MVIENTLIDDDVKEIDGLEAGAANVKEARIHVASQWKLIWWRFQRHKLALVSGIVLLLIYVIVLLAEFIAPYDPSDYSSKYTYAPPQTLNLFDTTDGQFTFMPHV